MADSHPSWLSRLLYQLLPGTCVLCKSLSHRPLDLCEPCQGDLPDLPYHRCYRCALPIQHEIPLCAGCILEPPHFHHTFSLYRYSYPLGYLINGFKHHGQLSYGQVMGQLLAEAAQIHFSQVRRPDLLTAVPLHPRRRRERGYNQALELARPLAKALNIPLASRMFERRHNTPPQQHLSRSERRRNLRGAFGLNNNLQGARLLIVDDVMTTGATVDAMAKLAAQAGALSIDIITVARALPPDYSLKQS